MSCRKTKRTQLVSLAGRPKSGSRTMTMTEKTADRKKGGIGEKDSKAGRVPRAREFWPRVG